jgi:hypothetical protein
MGKCMIGHKTSPGNGHLFCALYDRTHKVVLILYLFRAKIKGDLKLKYYFCVTTVTYNSDLQGHASAGGDSGAGAGGGL